MTSEEPVTKFQVRRRTRIVTRCEVASDGTRTYFKHGWNLYIDIEKRRNPLDSFIFRTNASFRFSSTIDLHTKWKVMNNILLSPKHTAALFRPWTHSKTKQNKTKRNKNVQRVVDDDVSSGLVRHSKTCKNPWVTNCVWLIRLLLSSYISGQSFGS